MVSSMREHSMVLHIRYQSGVSVPALMEEYGISRASVFRYLQSEKR